MNNLLKNGSLIAILLMVVVLSLSFNTFTEDESNQDFDAFWLSDYVGTEVVVLFDAAPWPIGKPVKYGFEVKTELVRVEEPGIVLKFGKQETFFSYGHIISITPSTK